MTPHRWPFPRRFSFVFVALVALAASARGQAPLRIDDKPPPRNMPARALEASIYLELYGHPDTAHRRIEVRVARDHVELLGTVAAEPERVTAERLAALVV